MTNSKLNYNFKIQTKFINITFIQEENFEIRIPLLI